MALVEAARRFASYNQVGAVCLFLCQLSRQLSDAKVSKDGRAIRTCQHCLSMLGPLSTRDLIAIWAFRH